MNSKIKPLDYSVLTIGSLVSSAVCIVIGGLVLLGWWIDIEYLKSVVPSFVTMKVNTALCFIFGGCSLFLLHRNLTKHNQLWLAQIFATLAGTISLLTLLEIIFQWNLGIDELLLKQPLDNFVTAAPGRMAFATALTFFLISIALLLLGFEHWKAEAAAQIIALVTSIIPLISLICYLYNVEPIYEVAAFSSMAIHTALTAALLCMGVLLLRPTQGFMRVITSPHSGGIMLRRLLPVVILGPIILGGFRLLGQTLGYYNTIFGLVLMVISNIVIFVLVLWFNSRSINQLDYARAKAEQSLRESEERLRLATEAALIGTWDRDLKTGKLFWSPSQERLMGFEPGTFPCTYEAFAELIHPQDHHVLAEARQVAQSNGGHYQAELRFILPDGRERWGLVYGQMLFDEQNIPVRLVGVDFDITERKRTEQALRDSETRLAGIVESAMDAIITVDVQQKVIFFNQSAEQMFGYKPEEILGESISILIPIRFRSGHEKHIHKFGLTGETMRAMGALRDVSGVRKGGEEFPIEASISQIEVQGQHLFTVILRDITARKRTEEALRDSEEKFRTLVEQASDAFFVHDTKGNFLDINQHACESLGYSQAELLQMNVFDVEQDFEREGAQKIWAEVQPGQASTLYGHQRRRDGTIFPVEVRWSCFDFQGQRLFLDLVRDITERQQMEEAVRQSEAHFRVIFEGAGVGNIECEATTGQFLLVNEKMCEIIGYAAEELCTMSFRDITHPDDQTQNFEEYQRFIRGELPYYFVEKRYVRKDSTIVWVQVNSTLLKNAQGQPWRTIAVIQDITERKHTEELLQKSELRFRELIESLPQFIWTCTSDGSCDYLSPQWVQYTGIPAQTQLGWSWLARVHPDDSERLTTDWQAAIKAADILDTEFRVRRHDGTFRWFRTRAVPIRDEAGRPLRWFGNNIDIENLKQAEMNIRQLNAGLEVRVIERTQELAAANRELEAFSYSVSHDLRAPLRAIDGFSRILAEDFTAQLPPDAIEYLHLVRENTQKMGDLIDDLLNLSRITRQALTKQLVTPGKIARQVLGELQSEQAGRQIEITIGDMHDCYADQGLLKQVFVNLLTNALKFTRRCEVALIEVGMLHAAPPTSTTVYFVKDNGAGFNMKYAHKLFQVFQRLHRMEDFEGTGVGLAIVQRIINRHGGRVWAESVLNQGTTFYFTLEGEPTA